MRIILSLSSYGNKLLPTNSAFYPMGKKLWRSLDDEAYSIQQTTDGGYIAAGLSNSNDGNVSGNHGDYDYWIVKIDGNGALLWQKCFGGTFQDNGDAIQQTKDGGFIVAGMSYSNDDEVTGHHGDTMQSDSWIIKIDGLGKMTWETSLGGINTDFANSIQQTADGGYIVGGSTESDDGDVTGNHGIENYWIVKLNDSGVIQWERCYGGTNSEQSASIQQTSDGGFIVAGLSQSDNGDVTGHHGDTTTSDYWVIKLDGSGNLLWEKSLGGKNDDQAYAIQQTRDGGYIVAGMSTSNDFDVSGNHGFGDYWVVKLSDTGKIQWEKCYGGSAADWATAVQQTKDGGYVVAGWSQSTDGDVTGNIWNSAVYWIVKIDSIGTIQWQEALGGSGSELWICNPANRR